MDNKLPKKERLSGKAAIGRLMTEARYGTASDFRYCYAVGNGEDYNRIIISVSKRFFKRAVKRNLLKRRIREAYRTQKGLLTTQGVDIMFIYNTKEVLTFAQISETVATILGEINAKTKK